MTREEIDAGMAYGRQQMVERAKSLSYQEFKRRIAEGSLGVLSERMDSRIHSKSQMNAFMVFCAFYMAMPLAVSITATLFTHQAIYFVPCVVSFVGVRMAVYPNFRNSLPALLSLILIVEWVLSGINGRPWVSIGLPSWIDLSLLATLWACFWFQVADQAMKDYTRISLLDSEECFHAARDGGLVLFVDLRGSPQS